MKLYDISRELFSAPVYPGDPTPRREILKRMELGELYNLSAFYTGCHSATHVDAPRHFVQDGKTIEEIPLEHFIGRCTVVEISGLLLGEQMDELLPKCQDVILFKGGTETFLTESAAFALREGGVRMVGTEAASIAPIGNEQAPHVELLGAGIPILEGLDLSCVPPAEYTLIALPLYLKGAEASPVRAILLDTVLE